ncbi:hypothetical protein AYI68_g4525 [Smittium mucronatum]|uniref:Ski2 N-terminal domain-containing protein n=1 Tax=Smittium mucronatum TaxID=133383 RepID=A0A1R0GWV9_9FUNG|nr:hypothetical protein AYI68_g4525 [Smittium mucronatum]
MDKKSSQKLKKSKEILEVLENFRISPYVTGQGNSFRLNLEPINPDNEDSTNLSSLKLSWVEKFSFYDQEFGNFSFKEEISDYIENNILKPKPYMPKSLLPYFQRGFPVEVNYEEIIKEEPSTEQWMSVKWKRNIETNSVEDVFEDEIVISLDDEESMNLNRPFQGDSVNPVDKRIGIPFWPGGISKNSIDGYSQEYDKVSHSVIEDQDRYYPNEINWSEMWEDLLDGRFF